MGKKGVDTPDATREFIITTARNAPKLTNSQIVDKVVDKFGKEAGLDKSTVGRIRKKGATLERSIPASTTTDDIEQLPTPQLVVSLEGLDHVDSGATILPLSDYRPIGKAGEPTQSVWVRVYRIKVTNIGGGAAEHVAGTLEFEGRERRICWVEGNVPYFDINAHDHSYLNAYGVLLDPQDSPTTDIVMPTEHGWDNLMPGTLTAPLEVTLRVTAANALPATTSFCIDPTQACEPIPGRLSVGV